MGIINTSWSKTTVWTGEYAGCSRLLQTNCLVAGMLRDIEDRHIAPAAQMMTSAKED